MGELQVKTIAGIVGIVATMSTLILGGIAYVDNRIGAYNQLHTIQPHIGAVGELQLDKQLAPLTQGLNQLNTQMHVLNERVQALSVQLAQLQAVVEERSPRSEP